MLESVLGSTSELCQSPYVSSYTKSKSHSLLRLVRSKECGGVFVGTYYLIAWLITFLIKASKSIKSLSAFSLKKVTSPLS